MFTEYLDIQTCGYKKSFFSEIEKKLLIRSVVKKVIITDYDNIEIVYKY